MMRGRPVDTREPFELDLADAVSETVRDDERAAMAVYAALCNVEWVRSDGRQYTTTWRDASQLISGIRGQGDHDLAFYLSGNEGTVAPTVADALAKRGWFPRTD